MKINRIDVYNKYNGHCAYCGVVITIKKMEVDHYWPQILSHRKPELDINGIDNLMPSCQKCNNHKHGMRPEEWRRQLGRQVSRIKSTQFDRALRFGQIQITEIPIVFYFERR